MKDAVFKVHVACYAGYRGEETPRRIRMGRRDLAVIRVLDRWLAPDHRYFKLLCDDRGVYIVRHDPHGHRWELTFFQSGDVVGKVESSLPAPPRAARVSRRLPSG